jgi:hypothetical protein
MVKISKKEMNEMVTEVEKEFPNDPALQQVHISRRIIHFLAKKEGKTTLEIIKLYQ